MEALFCGLGSIGTRHLKNLSALCDERGIPLRVTALRSSERALPEDVAPLVAREIRAPEDDSAYDLAFLTNPTHLHAQALAHLRGKVGTFFIEKPIFESTGYDLAELGLPESQKAYVAAPMRWTALYQALKKTLAGKRVYSARAICSSYLPDWRKNVDYRTVYSARAAQGGGVTLDLIHEWDYLTDLFGLPQKCYNLRGQYSHLEIDSDDLSIYIAQYPGLLCELHLDYFGREYRRTVEIFTEEGTFVADFGAGILHLPDGATEDHSEPSNRRYQREMAAFLDYALGQGENANPPRRALDVLKIALGE